MDLTLIHNSRRLLYCIPGGRTHPPAMHLRNLPVLCLASLALLLGACERAADVSSPQHVMTDGVAFDYPGNWEIRKNELQSTGRYIQIRSPGSAVVMIRIFQPNVRVNLNDYAHRIGETMEKDFANSALLTPGQAMTYTEVNKPGPGGHSISLHYSVKVASVDVPHTMTVREWSYAGSNQVVATVQVADKHAYQAQPGFDLIMSTLKPAR